MRCHLALRVCAIALFCLGWMAQDFAEANETGLRAVLVAGDNAQPVFDNAVNAIGRWLLGRGVPRADIHRLSASREPADATVEPASADRILARIASLRAQPGERCLVFITSHGSRDEGIRLAAGNDYLTPSALAQALSLGCGAVPTVVIVSSCYSGAFAAAPMRAPNRIILTAARADRPSFGCQADRTFTVFDECLLATLPQAATWRRVFNLNSSCVRQREKSLNVLPSQPQAAFGPAVRDLAVR